MQATNWLKAGPKGRIWSKKQWYNFRKNDTQDLVPDFSRTDGFKYSFFNRIVNEWSGLPSHIRESNSIATFKKNVLSFIKDY